MSTSHGPTTLIIHNGGFPALLASLIAESESDSTESAGRGRGTIYAWLPPVGTGLFADEPPYVAGSISARNRAEMVDHQAKLFGFRDVFADDPAGPRHRPSVASLLLRAVELAADHRCERVVWPISVGSDLEALHRVTEQAAMVTELAAIDPSLAGDGASAVIRVSTPLADLEQGGLDELAEDLGAPMEACWRPVVSPVRLPSA
jgi:hypothetical protein